MVDVEQIESVEGAREVSGRVVVSEWEEVVSLQEMGFEEGVGYPRSVRQKLMKRSGPQPARRQTPRGGTGGFVSWFREEIMGSRIWGAYGGE